MNKKIISLFLIICMLCVPGISLADDNVETEIAPSKAYNLLNELGLVTFDEAALDKGVLNEDFAMIMAYISGRTDEIFDENALEMLTGGGYMLKISSAPNAEIKQIYAVKAIVSLLGYDIDAEYSGGYPNGYSATAAKIGVLDRVDFRPNDVLTNRQLCDMLCNAMQINIKEQVAYGTQARYEIMIGKTFLYDKLGIVKSKGRVTANEFTNLSEGYRVRQNYIEVDGSPYTCEKNYNEYIGHKVIYYYLRNDDVRSQILYMECDESAEASLEISSDEFGLLSNSVMSYYMNDSKRTANLNGSYTVIYNGKSLSDYSILENLNNDFNGSICAVDSDLDGKYDFLNIKNQKTIYVGFADETEACIYDKYDAENNICYDLDSSDYAVYYSADGSKQDVSKIKTGNVLTIEISEDESLYTVYISTASVQGVMTAKNISDREVIVGDNTYGYTSNVKPEIESLTMLEEIKAYLDINGKIAGFEKIDPLYVVGYVQKVVMEENLAQRVRIRLFTDEGTFKEYDILEGVRIDKNKPESKKEIYEKLWNSAEGKPKYELIKCRLNELGAVTSIITSDDEDNLFNICNSSGINWYRTPKSFMGKCIASGNAKVFIVPSDDVYNDDRYGLTTTSYLKNGSKYNVSAYTSGKTSFIAENIIIKMEKSEDRPVDTYVNNFAVFKGFSEVLESDGSEVNYILATSLSSGTELQIPVFSKNDAADLAKGDIFRYNTGIKGYMSDYYKIYDKDDGIIASRFTFNNTDMWSGVLKTGYVVAITADGICFTCDGGGKPASDRLDMNTNMLVFALSGSPAWMIYHTEESDADYMVETTTSQYVKSYVNAGDDCDQVIIAGHEGRALAVILIRK